METVKGIELLGNYYDMLGQIQTLQARAERYAVNTWQEHKKEIAFQLKKLKRYYDRRDRLIDRCMLVRFVLHGMEKRDRAYVVFCYIKKRTFQDIEDRFPFSRRTFYRHRQLALARFMTALNDALASGKW